MIGMGHFDLTISWNAWGLGFNNINTKDYMKVAFLPGVVISLVLEIVTFLLYSPI
jgi:hypothetical protein